MKQKTNNSNLDSTQHPVRENPQALAGQQQGADKRIGNYLVGKSTFYKAN